MKKPTLLLVFLSLTLIFTIANAEEISMSNSLQTEIKYGIVYPYFEALIDGDINAIKRYISSDMYTRYKRLLEQNRGYPEFLRNYYQGAKFRIEKAKEIDGYVVVDVVIEFPNGSRIQNKLCVSEEKSKFQGKDRSHRWKISAIPLDRDQYHLKNESMVE